MVPTHFHLVSTIRAASGELRPLRLNCAIEYIAGTSAGRSVRTLYRSRESDKKHEGIKSRCDMFRRNRFRIYW